MISLQSAPMRSDNSARVLAIVIEATKQQLIAILASSALSYRMGRIGQPKAPSKVAKTSGSASAGFAQPTIYRSGRVARSTARPNTSVST